MLIIYYIHKPSGVVVHHHSAREEYTKQQLDELIEAYNERTPLYTAVAAELEEGSLETYLIRKLEKIGDALRGAIEDLEGK